MHEQHKNKHATIQELYTMMRTFADHGDADIRSAKEKLEAAYTAYERSPEDYLTAELAVASAKSMLEAIFLAAHHSEAAHMPLSEWHRFADELSPKEAEVVHKALHNIDDYTYWHREHEFDDRSRPIDQ